MSDVKTKPLPEHPKPGRRKSAQLNLRIDPTLKAAAEQAAADDRRSLTGLIEKLLDDYLRSRRRPAAGGP